MRPLSIVLFAGAALSCDAPAVDVDAGPAACTREGHCAAAERCAVDGVAETVFEAGEVGRCQPAAEVLALAEDVTGETWEVLTAWW